MSYASDIEWTESTWNPATGCRKISPGCKHCYAERFAERFRAVPGHPFEQGFDLKLYPERLEQPLTWKRPRLIFVNSMSDLFLDEIPEEFILSVFDTMRRAAQHTFQVLTKRAARLAEFCESHFDIVPANVWLGVSIENQSNSWRSAFLRKVRVGVRFVSCEPLLGPVELDLRGIHWVIVGGESGPGARPMEVDWVRSIREQCNQNGVPFFFKQWGGVHKKKAGRLLDGRTWNDMPRSELVAARTIPSPFDEGSVEKTGSSPPGAETQCYL